MTNPRPTYSSVDLVKFIAALLVVALHARPFIFDEDMDYYAICFCRIAVPFFFVATSFFFFLKEKPDIKKYTKKTFNSIYSLVHHRVVLCVSKVLC